ncbi:MAG: GTP 3',8-cyclase MoaA [Planctomycetia bacterium]
MPTPADTLGRPLRDLRISVTDRCSFRCPYCMPREVYGPGHAFLPRAELLTFEELERVARAFVALGVTKLRLTGGEPLLRRDLDRLVARLAAIPGVEDLALTTNGTALAAQAALLRQAGLRRLTLSCDAVDEATFQRMNDAAFPFARFVEGLEAAERAGFGPLKVNCVVRRGWNEHGVEDLVRFFRARGHVVRFIEYMDVGHTNGWRLDDVVPSSALLARLQAAFALEPVGPRAPGATATRWRFRDGPGEVGFVSSVSQPFCGDCTRARLSADGRVFTCLFATQGHDLKADLRGGLDDAALRERLAGVWRARADRYSELRTQATPAAAGGAPRVEMSLLGG